LLLSAISLFGMWLEQVFMFGASVLRTHSRCAFG
jgi:hypothetical protein